MGIASGTTTVANNWTDVERSGFGWTAGSTQNYSLSWGSDDSAVVANSNTFRRARNDYCFTTGSSGSTAYPQIKLNSFQSGGANFDYDLNDTNLHRVNYIAIGGTDITACKAGDFLPNTTTGNQSVTGLGFRPDIIFFLTGNSPAPPAGGASSTPHMSVTWGVAKSSTARGCFCLSAVDNLSTTDSARYQRTDRCIAYFTDGSVVLDGEADMVSLDGDGFTINWINSPSVQNPIFYLAIQGGAWNVGATTSRTSTDGVGNTAITGLGGTPRGVILLGHQGSGSGAIQTNSKLSWGAAASTSSAWNIVSGNMDATTVPSSYRSYNNATSAANAYVYRSHELGTANQDNPANTNGETTYLTSRALIQSFDAGGFTLNWETVDASARQVIYVTVGDNQGLAITKVQGTETVTLTEASNKLKALTRIPTTTGETLSMAEGAPVRALGRLRIPNQETVSLGEGTPIAKVLRLQNKAESLLLDEVSIALGVKRRVLPGETLTFSETLNKVLVTPTQTLQASALQLRYSGGVSNSSTTASRGGAISNNSVTDDTLNNTWDDITAAQSAAGIVEYRCFYIYNSSSTLTAYNCEMWVDTTTPAGDSIEIAVGGAAVSGTEQDLTAQPETFAPNSPSLSFSTAPDAEGAIPLGDIPPLGYRSFWIKRIVPAATPSWSDNQYRLRMSFFSNHT